LQNRARSLCCKKKMLAYLRRVVFICPWLFREWFIDRKPVVVGGTQFA
jgi:hypothetical protein